MAKFRSLIVACLLILTAILFVACGQTQVENISFKENEIFLIVGDRIELEINYEPQNAESNLKYSVSDESIVYVLPNSNTAVALKAGSAVIYAETENGKTASINVQVVETKQKLTTPSNLTVDRENNKLTWIAVPAAFQYEVEINYDNKVITKLVGNNYLNISDVDGLTLQPGKVIDFKVRAIASATSAYQNSNWTDLLTFDELNAVQNLAYDIENGKIIFDYSLENAAKSNQDVYFQVTIIGAIYKTFRINKNSEGKYIQEFAPTKAGEYTISVVAMMSGKNTSLSKVIKLNKLESTNFEQNGTSITSKWNGKENDYRINLTIQIDNQEPSLKSSENEAVTANIAISSNETAVLKSSVEKINKEQTLDGVKTYYLASEIDQIVLNKLDAPINLQVEKINDKTIKLVWLYDEFSYKIYSNEQLVECEQEIVEKNSVKYIETIIKNLEIAGDYQFQVVACKEHFGKNYYLDSERANFKKVVKLSSANIKFNSETSNIEYQVGENHIDGNIGLTIKNGTTTNITERILSNTGNIAIKVENAGNYIIEINISKNSSDAIYLSAETESVRINKLSLVDYENELSQDNSEMTIIFEKNADVNSYKFYLNEEEISEVVSESNIYRTRVDDVTINNQNYGRFVLKNINSAGKFVLSIVAIGNDDFEENNYILNSDASKYEFYKLASPTLNFEKISSKIVKFTWNSVSGSNVIYEIKAENFVTGEIAYSATTSSTSYNITFENSGDYKVTVTAKSSKNNYLKSNILIENCNVEISKLESVKNINHNVELNETSKKELSIVTNSKIENADGYLLTLEKVENSGNTKIGEFNSFEINDNNILFNLGESNLLFAEEGKYIFKIYGVSTKNNVLDSEYSSITINKLSAPENISIEYGENSTNLKFASQDQNTKYKISIDGLEFVEINTNSYDISTLKAGLHEFKLMSVGNNTNVLDSNIAVKTLKVFVRLETPSDLQIEVDDSDDSKILISFNCVENASYYEIIIEQTEEKVITFKPTLIEDRYAYTLARTDFEQGLQNICIIAKPADDSEQFERSFASNKIYIEKSSAVNKVELNADEKLVVFEKQALINGTLYANNLVEISKLFEGQKLTFAVRNISTIIDGFDTENKFYLASDWAEVELIRLTTPQISMNGENVTINYIREGVDFDLIIDIDFFALNNESGQPKGSFKLNLTTLLGENQYNFNIKEFITNNLTIADFVGDYKFSISAKPKVNENFKLYITSKKSAENSYKHIENIENNNAIYSQENSGIINLKINKKYLEKINKLYFEINQNSKKCIFEINRENNLLNILENNLNSVEIKFEKNILENEIEFKINIYKLINSGEFDLSWSLKGDEKYYISPENLSNVVLNKLKQPEFNYVSDILGNKIILTQETVSAMPNALFIAKYNDVEMQFSNTSEGVYLYLPYEWTTLNNIQIFAIANKEGYINSDEVIVNFERANKIESLGLWENSLSDKLFLGWQNSASREYIIYISQDNFQTQKIYTTSSHNLELTEDLLNVGDVTFRVVVKGYSEEEQIYLNSEYVELKCTKLDNQTEFSNPNGILTWEQFNQESLLKGYRIKTSDAQINLTPSTHSYAFENYFGYLTFKFKLVGDTSQNVISSNYKTVNIYKFSKPTSFKIQNGKFNIDENIVNITLDSSAIDYLINIENSSFLYSEYENYSDEMIEKFYQMLQTNSGVASANVVVKTGTTIEKNDVQYLVVNSDKSDDKNFGVYQIDIEKDEFYLTQTKLSSGEVETYFNWEWVDSQFADEGTVRIILKPQFETNNNVTIDGWKTIFDKNNHVTAYYIDIAFNNTINSGEYISSSLCLKLPSELKGNGAYIVQVQKTSIDSETNLSSQNVNVLSFKKLDLPDFLITGGKIHLMFDHDANYYQMLYTVNEDSTVDVSTAWDVSTWGVATWSDYYYIDPTASVYQFIEPDSLFESLNSQKSYLLKMIAFGNVTELKPEENLSAMSKEYIIASDTRNGAFTKLRRPGDFIIKDGMLYWDQANEYNYYKEEEKESYIEFKFLDLAMNELTKVTIPAKEFINDGSLKFFDNYLDAAQNVLNTAGKLIIQYRQLGTLFDAFINSEYKNLTIEGAPTITIDGETYNYFEFLNRAIVVSLTEENGLTFSAITYDSTLIDKVYYDVYFTLGKGKDAEIILATTLENKNNITFSELKDLLQSKDPNAIISQIFVVARGNDTYYLSSFKSAIKNVYTIKGEATIYIENGIIKWENIESAGSYQIKSVVDDEEFIYEIKYVNNKFVINNVETSSVYFETNSGNKTIWCFNIAAYDGLADAEHSLNIRYLPTNQGSDVFAIPGEWTANAIRVYKISKPNVELEKGVFVWEKVTNAISYRVTIKDENGNVIYVYNSDSTTYVLDLNELATELNKTVSEVITLIPKYQIAVQSVGPNASVNGVYFISSVEVFKTGLTLKTNTIENISISQDKLSWTDASNNNEYIIYISGVDNGVEILKTINTSEKYYDLSQVKLNGDNDTIYSVKIKIAGDDKQLASAESKQIDFKVLHSISEISLNKGYINFATQAGADSYTLTIEIASYTYNYTISIVGNVYEVTKVERITDGNVYVLDSSLETDMYYQNGRIYLWPVNVTMYQSAQISVRANGFVKDETTYISSYPKTYGTPIFKPDTSKITKGKISYDQATNQTKITWTTGTSFSLKVDVKLYKVENGERIEIDLTNATINATNIILNSKLEKGTYELSIQLIPQDDNYYLKSEWKTLTYTYTGK